jgi:hypothetical protein
MKYVMLYYNTSQQQLRSTTLYHLFSLILNHTPSKIRFNIKLNYNDSLILNHNHRNEKRTPLRTILKGLRLALSIFRYIPP